MPIGVYDHPPGAELSPTISYVLIPEDLGPFRLREYGKGLEAFTKWRDWLTEATDNLFAGE